MGELKGLESTEKLEVVIPLAREQLNGTNFPADALATAIHERNRAAPVQKMSEQVSRITSELKRLNNTHPEALVFLAATVRKDPKYLENLINRPKEIVDGLLKIADTAKQFSKTYFTNMAKKDSLDDASSLITYFFEATVGGLTDKQANIFIARTMAINSEPHKAIAADITAKVNELSKKKYALAEAYVDNIPTPLCLGMLFVIETWQEPKLHEIKVDRTLHASFENRMERKEFTWDTLLTEYGFNGPHFFSFTLRLTALGIGYYRPLDQKFIDNFQKSNLVDIRLASGELLNIVQRYRQIHDLWQKYYSKETVSDSDRENFVKSMWRGVRGRQPEALHIITDILTHPKINVSDSLSHLKVFTKLEESMRLGLYFMYDEAKKIARESGLDPNDPIVVLNFAYGKAVLGDARKVLALNKRWGVIHFMSFSPAKILAAYDTYNRMRSGKKLNCNAYVYMRAVDDNNSALYADRVNEPDPPKGVAVVIAESATDIKWRNQIKDVGQHVGQIVYLNQNAHGTPDSFMLGKYAIYKEKSKISVEDIEVLKLSELNIYFAKGAMVVLSACDLGKGQLRGLSVALSGAWTNARIFASTESVDLVVYLKSPGESGLIPIFKNPSYHFSPTHLYENGVVVARFTEKNGLAVRSVPIPIPGEVKIIKLNTAVTLNVNLPKPKRKPRTPNA